MGRSRKPQRDVTQLSGQPLSETLEPSPVLATPSELWVTSPDLTEHGLAFVPEAVQNTTFFLLANPNMSSTVLFRADILSDTETKTITSQNGETVTPVPAREIPGFVLTRTVVRRLVPRNNQLDRPLDQTCLFYFAPSGAETSNKRFLAVYTPHVASKEELPFYHPLLRSLALMYDFYPSPKSTESMEPKEAGVSTGIGTGTGVMSVHFLPYADELIHKRLERTLLNLLDVQIRLTRGLLSEMATATRRSTSKAIKDNLIPRNRVQDTYSRLKNKFAADLCGRWVERTEPSKHVFEDLGVAAFLIELWRDMYGCVPVDEQQPVFNDLDDSSEERKSKFPGFVDIACGNGVLVYILLQEGYDGWGFDARRRKTWDIFPDSVQEHLKEEIYIPKPFADELELSSSQSPLTQMAIKTHTASPPTFTRNTFIISSHADELTLWTPLLAILLNPLSPPPFLAIPCCSHSLSGARYRYPPPRSSATSTPEEKKEEEDEHNGAKSGDLKALRKFKQESQTPASQGFNKSTYGSLTAKLVAVAQEAGFEVEKTLLRIPSTRNIGVLGKPKTATHFGDGKDTGVDTGNVVGDEEYVTEKVREIVMRECAREGGVHLAARIWVERARGLHVGGGSKYHHT